MNSIEKLLYEELKDIYDAEKQLTKALPKMVKAAQSEELREALQEHLSVTEEQVTRLESVFDLIGQPAKGKTCEGMKGLIEEGKEAMEEYEDDPLKDVAIIGAAQRVEHYEIAAYGTVRTLAEKIGNREAAELLQQTLDEEKEADERLTEIAEEVLDGVESQMSEEDEESEEMGRRPQRMPVTRMAARSQSNAKKRRAS